MTFKSFLRLSSNHTKSNLGIVSGLAMGALLLLSMEGRTEAIADVKADIESRNYPLSLSGSYLAGRQAGISRDLDTAALFFSRALQNDPENVFLIERNFMVHLAYGDIDGALKGAEKVLTVAPKNAMAHLLLGVEAMRAKSYKTALKHFEGDVQGPLAELTRSLLRAWVQAGNGEAEKAADSLLALEGPDWYAGFTTYHAGLIHSLKGDKNKALELLQTAYNDNPNALRTAEAYIRELLIAGEQDTAAQVLERLLGTRLANNAIVVDLYDKLLAKEKVRAQVRDVNEGAMEVLYGLGAAIGREGAEEIAYIHLHLALHIFPNTALPRMTLGELLERDEKYTTANALYAKVPQDSVFRDEATIQRSLNLNALEKVDEAVALLNDMLEKNPNNQIAATTLGNIHRSHEKFAEARDAYSKGIDLIVGEPSFRDWLLFYFRGITNERLKEWPKAEVDFKQALKLSPEQPQVLNYLGYSWVDQNLNLDEALDMIRKAVELRPSDGYIVDSLGWAYYRLERFEEAVEQLEHAVELRPEDPVINDHLGDAYWKVGRKLEATFQWSHARDLKPEPEELEKIVRKLEVGLDEALEEDS